MVIRAQVPRRSRLRTGRRALAAGVGIAALAVVVTSSGASAASSGQHIWESGKVVGLADGDTVYVDVHGHTYSVRNLGIQATETSHAGVGKNECGAQPAKKYLTKLTLHKHVQLASMHESSESLGRLLRTVYVGTNKNLSRDLDVQAAEMSKGYTLWHPDPTDSAHNLYYHQLQVLAQRKHKHLWNPTFCGKGNDQGLKLKVWINSDANLSDAQHPNGEWVGVENMSKTRTANLSHWRMRDASHVGDPAYRFPKHTKLKPHQVLKLHSGKGHSSVKTRNFYNWGDAKARWDDGDTNGMGEGAYLQDRLGNIRSSDTYPCVVTAVTRCKDPLAKDLAWGQVEYAPGGEKQNPNLEYVTIRNTSTRTVNLSYRVVSHGGWVRTLMRGTVLKPGDQLKVYAGKGHNTPLAQHFGSPNALFANGGGDVLMRTPDYVQTMCVDWGNVHMAGCSRASANQ